MRNLRAFNYFGSKVSSAHLYPAPLYDTIIEPFAGGAGYSLLHWQRKVILIDANPDLTDAWRYLIESTPDDIMALPLLKKGQDVRELGLQRGAELLIGWCVNQSASPRWRLSSFAVNYQEDTARFWGNRRRKQMARVCQRVKHWRILNGSYEQAPDIEATWFIDPPYADAGINYPHSNIDYRCVAGWCKARRGQVIVCESEGATWLPFCKLATVNACLTRAGKGHKRYTEVIWTQGCGDEQQLELDLAKSHEGVSDG